MHSASNEKNIKSKSLLVLLIMQVFNEVPMMYFFFKVCDFFNIFREM